MIGAIYSEVRGVEDKGTQYWLSHIGYLNAIVVDEI